LKKPTAIDPVVFVVVRDIIGHSIGFWFGLFFDWLAYTCVYLLRPILFPGSLAVRLAIADLVPLLPTSRFALGFLRRLSSLKRRAQAWAWSAAFETGKLPSVTVFSIRCVRSGGQRSD